MSRQLLGNNYQTSIHELNHTSYTMYMRTRPIQQIIRLHMQTNTRARYTSHKRSKQTYMPGTWTHGRNC